MPTLRAPAADPLRDSSSTNTRAARTYPLREKKNNGGREGHGAPWMGAWVGGLRFTFGEIEHPLARKPLLAKKGTAAEGHGAPWMVGWVGGLRSEKLSISSSEKSGRRNHGRQMYTARLQKHSNTDLKRELCPSRPSAAKGRQNKRDTPMYVPAYIHSCVTFFFFFPNMAINWVVHI